MFTVHRNALTRADSAHDFQWPRVFWCFPSDTPRAITLHLAAMLNTVHAIELARRNLHCLSVGLDRRFGRCSDLRRPGSGFRTTSEASPVATTLRNLSAQRPAAGRACKAKWTN